MAGNSVVGIYRRVGVILISVAVPVGLGVLWWCWEPLLALLQSRQAFYDATIRWGWLGPPLLLGMIVLQIVIAPIPGYSLYFVAGFLFGWLWGGIWGTLGLLLGAMVAMGLARQIGRPFVARMVGTEQLARWETAIHSESAVVWALILFSPIGDTPFLLAGLSQVGFGRILLLTAVIRGPMAFAAAAVGAGAVALPWWQFLLLLAALGLPTLLLMRHQARLTQWMRKRVSPDVQSSD